MERRDANHRVPVLVLTAVVLVLALGGCGSSEPAPGDAVQSYLGDLADGNYTAACGMLSSAARSALVSSKGGHHPCQAIYRACLPSDPETLKRDQSQLLFDGVQSFITGAHARTLVSGTAVAREIRRVSLVRHRYRWFLVFPGEALQRCRLGAGRHGARARS